MLIVDASAVSELLLARPAGRAVALSLRDAEFDLHAPHLLDVEVLSALRRLVATGDASPERASEAVADLWISRSSATATTRSLRGSGSSATFSRRTTPCT
jgi:predicted nucleic acid-binding protein